MDVVSYTHKRNTMKQDPVETDALLVGFPSRKLAIVSLLGCLIVKCQFEQELSVLTVSFTIQCYCQHRPAERVAADPLVRPKPYCKRQRRYGALTSK